MKIKSAKLAASILSVLCISGIGNNSNALSTRPIDGDYIIQDQNIFLKDEVTICRITMDPDDFQDMLNDPESNEKKVATVRWQNSVVDQTLENVGIRPRGNTSRGAPRKSWKLDFNDFVPGRSFFGVEEMDLNGDNNDPTLLRRMMAHEFLRKMELPVSRTHYVAVYVNDEFRSVNIHVEAVDEQYVEHWFGNKKGNLYKCLFKGARADLSFRPENDYDTLGVLSNGQTYRETNNDPDSDYTDLSNFINFFNNSSNDTVYNSLTTQFHTDNFFRYLASSVSLGSWDDYWYGSNNFYLYHNEETNSFEIIPFDYDNSLGVDFFGVDWSERNFTDWGDGGFGSSPAPLVDEVFKHSLWRRKFRSYLLQGVDILEDQDYQDLTVKYHDLLVPWFDGTIESGGAVGTITSSNQHDPYFENFNTPENYEGFLNAHRQGIIPFLNDRAASLRNELSGFITLDIPQVYLNEIVTANASTVSDSAGDFDDWIEIYNADSQAVDLSGWLLTDNPSDPFRYVIPNGTTIQPNEYLVIFADDEPNQDTQTELHATFKLGSSGETIGLYTPVSEGTLLADFIPATLLSTNQSFGRVSDGSVDFQVFQCPTPGAMNIDEDNCNPVEPRTPPRLFINEFMADNDTIIMDNFNQFEDWVEIYNDEPETVDLGGLHLTDDLSKPTKWEFPNGTEIEGKGFLLVWADNDLEQNITGFVHAGFNLSKNGESIGIFDNDENLNQPIHTLSFSLQVTDITSGLLPDGDIESLDVLENITPGISNSPIVIIPQDDFWLYK